MPDCKEEVVARKETKNYPKHKRVSAKAGVAIPDSSVKLQLKSESFGQEVWRRKDTLENKLRVSRNSLKNPIRRAVISNTSRPSHESTMVAKLLGGKQSLGKQAASSADLIPAVREGLSYEAFSAISERLELTREQMGETLNIPVRTLARRKGGERLTPQESDRLYRLARIAARAEEVLGTLEKTRIWLVRPNRALGNVTPLSMLDTDEGTRQVEAVLGRLEHGVYS